MQCPVCQTNSYKDICPECGYDLENHKEYNNYVYWLSYSEIDKYTTQINIMKKNYDEIQNKSKALEESSYEKAKKAYNARNYELAKPYYEIAIQEENVDAYVDLAMIYRDEGMKTNSLVHRIKCYRKSKELLEHAVQYENTDAMMRLAESYLKYYFGGLPSIKKALDLYRRAIDLGDPEATEDLIHKYRRGYGVLRADYRKADELDDDDFL